MSADDILWWDLITDFTKVYMQGVYQKCASFDGFI